MNNAKKITKGVYEYKGYRIANCGYRHTDCCVWWEAVNKHTGCAEYHATTKSEIMRLIDENAERHDIKPRKKARFEMKIILASNNKNKLREFRNILEPLGYKVITQAEAGADIEVEETGATFEENAYLKAKAAYDITHLPVIADDSGLEVDALNGEPGVYSARYAEDAQRCEKVLSKLKGVPDEKRTARFVCAICYIDEKGNKLIVKGACEGKIGYEKRGTNGFSYDPIFMYGNRSFAELSAEEKNNVSHRARALKKFETYMRHHEI